MAIATQRTHAHTMRREPTVAEQRLWSRLRAAQLNGLRFRRQFPLGPYILDLYCRAARLAIELDGATHADPTRDQTRDAYLTTRAIKVLHFWNNEVMENTEGVLQIIATEAEARIYKPPTTHKHPNHPPSRVCGRG